MRHFDEILAIARDRHGDQLADRIGEGPKSAAALAAIPEAGFDVDACAFMPEDWFEELTRDTRIVRNPVKIRSVQENAIFLQSLRDRGGAGTVIGGWPARDYIGLIALLKSDGSRLGGTTGQYALRFMGRDGFILSRDVVARLIAEGVIDKPPTSKKALTAVQSAFNTWMDQSGKSLTEISRVLALSI